MKQKAKFKDAYRVIVLSIIVGLFAYVIDAAVDAFIFHEGSFLDRLILVVPPTEVFFRMFLLASFITVGIFISIFLVKRKQVELALEQSEGKYRTQFEEALDAIFLADAQTGIILDCNHAAAELVGREKSELIGKHQRILHPPEENKGEFSRTFRQHLREKKGQVLETQAITKNGEIKEVAIKANVFELKGKRIIQGIFRDITERKLLEERLSALNIYSRNLNTAKSMKEIYELTLDAAEKILGFQFADFLVVKGKMLCLVAYRGASRISSLELPLDGNKGITVRTARTGKPVLIPDISEEKAYVEGGLEMRSELAVPIKIEHRVLGVLNVENQNLNAFNQKDQELLEILASHAATAISNLDHTKNLRTYAREIRESQEKFKRLFMDNPEAATYVDSDFHILDANPRFSELFGYSSDEVKGKCLLDLIVPEDKKKEGEMLDKEAKKAYTYYDTVRRRKDGTLVPVSISSAPIIVEDQPIGYVGLYRDITERKMLEERLSALNFYGGKLNTTSNLQQVYELTLDAMEKTLGFEDATFMIVEKGSLKVVCQRGYSKPILLELPLNGTRKGITVRAVNMRKPVLVPDVKRDKDYVAGVPGIQSELAVPIITEDKILGVLDVESKNLEAFNEKDITLLQILASHAATAINDLIKKEKIENRSSQMASLMKSSAEMLHSTDLQHRLQTIAEAIRESGWRRVVISARDENLDITSPEKIVTAGLTDEERDYLWTNRQPGEVWRQRFGPEYNRFRIGEFYHLPWSDPWVRERFSEGTVESKLSPEEMVDWDPQDLLYAPLRLAEGRIVGVVSVDDPIDGRRPTKESLAPLELFLHQAAVAIENAKLIQQLNEAKKQIKEYANQLELKVKQRTRELMEAQNKLLKSERLAAIGEVAAMVGHDLRNPLTGIAGATYYLKMKSGSKRDKKTKEMLELIEEDIEHSNKIINDLLEYSREMQLELAETTPKKILKEALSLVEVPKNIQVLDLTRTEPKIKVDVEKMKRVFINVIKNAVDAMPKGGKLTIKSNKVDDNLEVAFTDTGIGMPKSVAEKLWIPLFTTKAKGMGLGLAICKRVVEAHQGNISVESVVGEGTTFTVTVPIQPELEGGEKIWVNTPVSLLSTTTKA